MAGRARSKKGSKPRIKVGAKPKPKAKRIVRRKRPKPEVQKVHGECSLCLSRGVEISLPAVGLSDHLGGATDFEGDVSDGPVCWGCWGEWLDGDGDLSLARRRGVVTARLRKSGADDEKVDKLCRNMLGNEAVVSKVERKLKIGA